MQLDRIDPQRFRQWGLTSFGRRALAALEPLRKAAGFIPRDEVIPDSQAAVIAVNGIWDHRINAPAGSWLYAMAATSAQAAGFTVQITDLTTKENLLSSPAQYQNLTGQSSVTLTDAAGQPFPFGTPWRLLPAPRPLTGPLNVQIQNLDTLKTNRVQLVLFILSPDGSGARNQWNDELDATEKLWRQAHAAEAEAIAKGAAPAAAAGITPGPDLITTLTGMKHQPFYITDTDAQATPTLPLLSAVSGSRIAVHQLYLLNARVQTIRLLDNLADLTGPLRLEAGRELNFPYQAEPHFLLSVNSAFQVNFASIDDAQPLGGISGFLKYRVVTG